MNNSILAKDGKTYFYLFVYLLNSLFTVDFSLVIYNSTSTNGKFDK